MVATEYTRELMEEIERVSDVTWVNGEAPTDFVPGCKAENGLGYFVRLADEFESYWCGSGLKSWTSIPCGYKKVSADEFVASCKRAAPKSGS